VARNNAEAIRWYRKAADQGDASAENSLGAMYVRGRGVGRDFALAHMWFSLAAANGMDMAANARDHLESQMTPNQIAEAKRLAREWKPTQ
jgi:TPR repeat protein